MWTPTQLDMMQMQKNTQRHLSTTRVMERPVLDGFSLMQVNGTKVYGPPENWIGPPPNSSCELFIRRVPRDMSAYKLLELFLRFGKIYQFRVPLSIPNGLRGYAFVRYTNEEDAECAMEVLNHCFIETQKTLNIVNSCEKCRLFVRNIPKHLTDEQIESGLRRIFPNMERIISGSTKTSQDSKRHVFVSFATHNEALMAKRSICPGIIRLWEEDVEVLWAIKDGIENAAFNKTLFFRNVLFKLNYNDLSNLIAQHVHPTTIRSFSKTKANAFVQFTCRQAAETVLQHMEGAVIGDSRLVVKWAQPSAKRRLRQKRKTDFDALLRLKCIANTWHIPVIIFGTYFQAAGIQYAAVLLRNAECKLRFVIVTLQPSELFDIHSRVCEVVVSLIDTIGQFPDYNYVFCAQNDIANLVGVVVFGPQAIFIASHFVPTTFCLDVLEILEISCACALLSEYGEEKLLQVYRTSCNVNNAHPYLSDWIVGQRIFGVITPNYRSKAPLRHNLDNTQVVLTLCYRTTGSIFSLRDHKPCDLSKFDCGHNGLPFVRMKLLPLSLKKSGFAKNHTGSAVMTYGHQALRSCQTEG